MNKIKNNIQDQMTVLLSSSIKQNIHSNKIDSHPVRVFDAAKSMIALNLNSPSSLLFGYLEKQKISDDLSSIEFNNQETVDTVSIYQLKESIDKSDQEKCAGIIVKLLKLSDGKHILEYLLELSLKKKGESLSVIWAIYKTLEFIGYSSSSDVRNGLLIATQSLIYDQEYKKNKGNTPTLDTHFNNQFFTFRELEVIGVLYEISKADFIRKEFINDSLQLFISYFMSDLSNPVIDENHELKLIRGRKELLKILEELRINNQNILAINALRAYMKNSRKVNRKKVAYYISMIRRI